MSRFRLDFSRLFAARNAQRRSERQKKLAANQEPQLFVSKLEERRVLSGNGLTGLISAAPAFAEAADTSQTVRSPTVQAGRDARSARSKSSDLADAKVQAQSHAQLEQRADAAAELLDSVLSLPAGAAGNKHLLSLPADEPLAGNLE